MKLKQGIKLPFNTSICNQMIRNLGKEDGWHRGRLILPYVVLSPQLRVKGATTFSTHKTPDVSTHVDMNSSWRGEKLEERGEWNQRGVTWGGRDEGNVSCHWKSYGCQLAFHRRLQSTNTEGERHQHTHMYSVGAEFIPQMCLEISVLLFYTTCT